LDYINNNERNHS